MSKRLRILLIVLIQTAVLIGMVAIRNIPFQNGVEVVLETAPVDPRDLMRGHYVQLRYNVAERDVPVEWTTDLSPGDTIYMELIPGDGLYWSAGRIFAELDDVPEGAVAIRGTIYSLYDSDLRTVFDSETSHDKSEPTVFIGLHFGIERYYANAELAQELEDLNRERRIGIAVRVAPSGQAAISALYIDEERVYEEGLF